MSRDPFEDNDQLPPWLRDIPLPPRPAGTGEKPAGELAQPGASAGVPAPQAPEEDNTLPDWLRDIGAGSTPTPSESHGQVPAWLQDEKEADAPAWSTGESDIPSWLRDSSKRSPAEPTDEDSLPNWLRASGESSPTPPSERPTADAEPLAPWLGGVTPEEPRSSTAPTKPDEKPDWLRDLIDESGSGETSTLPDWLQTQDNPAQPSDTTHLWEPEPPSTPPPTLPQIPPATSSGIPPTPPAPTPDAANVDDADIPSWLRDIPSDEIRQIMESGEEDITAEPFSFEDASEPRRAEPASDVPSWLANISQDELDVSTTLPGWATDADHAPAEPAGAASGEEDVPLWLRDLGDASTSGPSTPEPFAQNDSSWLPEPPARAEEQPVEPASHEVLPAWLQDVGQSQETQGGAASEQPSWMQAGSDQIASPEKDVPAWLQAQTPADLPAEDVPNWLRAENPPTLPATPAGPPAEELPSWLADAATSKPPDSDLPPWLQGETAASAPQDREEVPEWLRPSDASRPAEPARAESAASADPAVTPAPSGQDLPPWLRDDAGQPLPTAGAPGDANLPEWLRGETTTPPPARTEPPVAPTNVPDWLRDEPAVTPPAAPQSFDWFDEPAPAGTPERTPAAGESEFFGGAELPAWLRTPEAEPASEISPADARSLDWLTRLGGLDEDGTSVAAPTAKLPLRPTPTRTQSQVEALALLEQLAANPFPESAPEPVVEQASIWRRVGVERLLYVVLLIALLAALAFPTFFAALQTPPVAPGASDLFQQINALSDKDIVLVGYEWDARRISEMKPLENAVLDQLIQKHVKLVLVSTDPQGTLLLFDLRDRLEAAGYRPGGEDYVLLGYKPGGELALRSFAQDFGTVLRSDFQGSDATVGALARDAQTGQQRLTKLSDFSMLLVLSDDASDVQGWMEQVHRSVPQVPLGFLLPAETEPIVQPYLKQEQIYHLAGKQGALAYQSLRGDSGVAADQIARESAQQRLSILIFIGLLLLGAVVVGLDSVKTRRRKVS